MIGRVLVIAGSDSGGGAGIQADIKAITAMNAFAATAITALTAQNTVGVHGVFSVPPEFVVQQIRVVLSDIGADCIKLGMLATPAVIDAVADILASDAAGIPVVLDPVMVAKGGARLLEPAAQQTVMARLIPLATLVTPNAPEAEALTGATVHGLDGQRAAAAALRAAGAGAVLIKGGHLPGDQISDLLLSADGETVFEGPRLATRHTHGTGCTLASAIAAGIAQGLPLHRAVSRARDYVRDAIAAAPGFGAGHGPLDHAVWLSSGAS